MPFKAGAEENKLYFCPWSAHWLVMQMFSFLMQLRLNTFSHFTATYNITSGKAVYAVNRVINYCRINTENIQGSWWECFKNSAQNGWKWTVPLCLNTKEQAALPESLWPVDNQHVGYISQKGHVLKIFFSFSLLCSLYKTFLCWRIFLSGDSLKLLFETKALLYEVTANKYEKRHIVMTQF